MADFSNDSDQIYGWNGAQFFQTWAEHKAQLETELTFREYPESDETKLAGIEAGATADQNAAEVPVDTTNFNNNLSPADSTVQAALETIDEFTLGGGGGGDFMADGSVPMTGVMTFDSPATETIYTRILRDDGTMKLAYGSRDTVNQFELLLVNVAGDAEVNKLLLKEDGNIAAPFAAPVANDDLVTKAYGDANYGGGGGGIPIVPADPSTPATGDAWVNETDGLLKFKSATGTIVFEATQFIAD